MKKIIPTWVVALGFLTIAAFAVAYLFVKVTVDEPIRITGTDEISVYPGESYKMELEVTNLANATHRIKFALIEESNEKGILYDYKFEPKELTVASKDSKETNLTITVKHSSPIGELMFNVKGERLELED